MARPAGDVFKRFKAKVNNVSSGCHEWASTIKKDGYGSFHYQGRQAQAHRVAYELFRGQILGRWVLHKCDNRRCVNPDHLFLGAAIDNIRDMDAKARRGTKSKFTKSDAEEIKRMLKDRYSQQHVANLYGVSQAAISRVNLGKTKLFMKE